MAKMREECMGTVRDMIEQNRSFAEIGRTVGCSEHAVKRAVIRMGLEVGRRSNERREWPPEQEAEFRRRLEGGESWAAVSRFAGCSEATLRRWARDAGLSKERTNSVALACDWVKGGMSIDEVMQRCPKLKRKSIERRLAREKDHAIYSIRDLHREVPAQKCQKCGSVSTFAPCVSCAAFIYREFTTGQCVSVTELASRYGMAPHEVYWIVNNGVSHSETNDLADMTDEDIAEIQSRAAALKAEKLREKRRQTFVSEVA